LQLVTRAAKKARTFEIQKLVRKVKSDKAKAEIPAGTSKLHAELEDILTTLKALDVDGLASNALSSKLHKDKSGLQDNIDVQAFLTSHPTQQLDGTSVAAKAQNRVLASKVMVQCMQEVLESLRERAGIAPKNASKQQKADQNSGKGDTKPALTSQNLAKATEAAQKARKAAIQGEETSSEEESDEEGSGATVSHISAEESIPDDEFNGIDATSETDSGSDHDSDAEDAQSISGASASSFPTISKRKAKDKQSAEKSKAKKQKTAELSPPITSEFLPSLAAGYTLGDSDGSVYSDDEAADTKPVRKNRRGQRARQA